MTIQTLINQKDKNGKRLFNNSYIAKYIGVHRSTISRELKNRKSYRFMIRSGRTIEKPYNATDAQNNYLFKRSLSKGQYKLQKYSKMAEYIETHCYFEKDGFCSISTPTVYSAIRNIVIDVKIEDSRRMKYEKEYEYKTNIAVPANKAEYSIEIRPEEINNRSVFGHFEIDTVIGTRKGKHECLLTMTERKTKLEDSHFLI